VTNSHLEEVRLMIEKAKANEVRAEAEEATPCPWVCATACSNCGMVNCTDRLCERK
jgi:hypothetical protein